MFLFFIAQLDFKIFNLCLSLFIQQLFFSFLSWGKKDFLCSKKNLAQSEIFFHIYFIVFFQFQCRKQWTWTQVKASAFSIRLLDVYSHIHFRETISDDQFVYLMPEDKNFRTKKHDTDFSLNKSTAIFLSLWWALQLIKK